MNIEIPVSAGDLIDRITILRIKREHVLDKTKRDNVCRELECLTEVRDKIPGLNDDAIRDLEMKLFGVNQQLWNLENELRVFENEKRFGRDFVSAARNVYLTNDKRAQLKKEISVVAGSSLREEKWFSVVDS